MPQFLSGDKVVTLSDDQVAKGLAENLKPVPAERLKQMADAEAAYILESKKALDKLRVVSMLQLKSRLYQLGLLDRVESFAKEDAVRKLMWENLTQVEVGSSMMQYILKVVGAVTDEEIQDFFKSVQNVEGAAWQ